jgi:hypothetical protein
VPKAAIIASSSGKTRFALPRLRLMTLLPWLIVESIPWSVFERGGALKRDLIAVSAKKGAKAETLTLRNRRRSLSVYVDAYLGKGVGGAQYSLSIRR